MSPSRLRRSGGAPYVPVALLVLGAGALLRPGTGPDHGPAPADTMTFTRDVAPILYRRCAVCHRPDGAAPFSLLTYPEARERAALIAAVTASRHMPPWLPAPGYGAFADERRLTEREITILGRWAAQGAARGDPGDLPPVPTWPAGWQLGPPDLVVRFPAVTVAAGGPEQFRNLVARASVGRTQYVAAVEVRPGSARLVHHARLMVDTTASSRHADQRDPAPGFDGMELASEARSPAGVFVGWTPGKVPTRATGDLAWRLDPATDLVLQLHLRPGDRAERVEPLVGLHFTARPPARRPALVMLGTKTIDIPPGEAHYVIEDRYELPVSVELLGVYPHAHYLAREMDAYAMLPNGSHVWLLRIPDWDFNWQDEYRYAAPVSLPRGTTLHLRYTYDNSAANPRNPSRPPRQVRYGPHSTDEMADLVLQAVTRNAGDAAILERGLAWKYYTEEIASEAYGQYATGRDLAAQGRRGEALVAYRRSLDLRFDDPRVHAAIGELLLDGGEVEPAVAHLEQALRLARAAGDTAIAAVVEALLDRAARTGTPRP